MLSVNDKNGLDRVYILLNSVKRTKKADTIINYYLILEDAETNKHYFDDLVSDDFRIVTSQLENFEYNINLPQTQYLAPANKHTMVRCLAPRHYSSIQKMLYVDTDIVFLRGGIEELFNTNIKDYYCAGCEDIIITNLPALQIEKANTKNSNDYINAGVILFNFKKIRKDKLDIKLASMCRKWKLDEVKPYYLDQSLINYLFRGKIKYLDYKYNDFSLVTSSTVLNLHSNYLKQKYGYQNVLQSLQDAVILHFLGTAKPWKEFDNNIKQYYPFIDTAKDVWKQIQRGLKKK